MDKIVKLTLVVSGGVLVAVYSDSEEVLYRVADLDIKDGEIPEFNSPDIILPASQHMQVIYE